MAETKLIQQKLIELIKKEEIVTLIKGIQYGYKHDPYGPRSSYINIYSFAYKYIQLFKEITQFLYLITDETILNQLYFDQLIFDRVDTDNLTILIRNYRKYREQMNGLVQFKIPDYIKIPFQNKIQSIYSEYDNIINKCCPLKKMFRQFIISKYNECLKYLEYAEEEYLGLEKLLSSLSKINKYCADIDNLVTNIIMLPIKCFTFCISTHVNIIGKYITYEINEQYINYRDNVVSTFAQLYCSMDYALIPEEYQTWSNAIVRF